MSNNLGRNDPCWCTSGKKYKRCHLASDAAAATGRRAAYFEGMQGITRKFSSKYCSAPRGMRADCKGKISRAHSVPKSSLRRIASEGHVLSLQSDGLDLMRTGGELLPKRIGVGDASVFTGFCTHHDNALFSAVEDRLFEATAKQCFLLAYRALAREVFMKKAGAGLDDVYERLVKTLQPDIQGGARRMMKQQLSYTQAGLASLRVHKREYDSVLAQAGDPEVRSLVITFGEVVPVMCCGSIYPECDMNGQLLQDYSGIPRVMSYSLFASGGRSHAVFSWLPSSDECVSAFADSLTALAPERLCEALVLLAVAYLENTFLGHALWESWGDSERLVVQKAMHAGATVDRTFEHYRPGGCLDLPWEIDRITRAPE